MVSVFRWWNWTSIQDGRPNTHRHLPLPPPNTWTEKHQREPEIKAETPSDKDAPTHGHVGPPNIWRQGHIFSEDTEEGGRDPQEMRNSQPLHEVATNSPTGIIYICRNRDNQGNLQRVLQRIDKVIQKDKGRNTNHKTRTGGYKTKGSRYFKRMNCSAMKNIVTKRKKKKTQDMGCLVELETEIQIWEQAYQGQMEF